MIGLCILFGDFLSSWVAKPFFSRLRPTHTPELQETLHYVYGYHGKLYGFFSGHSANYTAVATFLCLVLCDHRFTGVISLLVGWVIYSHVYRGAFPVGLLSWGACRALGGLLSLPDLPRTPPSILGYGLS